MIFVGRSLRHTVRNVDALIMAIALPVILMLLFVFVFGGAIEPGGGYVDYVVPGIILLCAGFGAAGTAVGVAEDMTTGIIDRFRTMPIASAAVITGHVVASLLRNLVATAVVIVVALVVGFRPSAGPVRVARGHRPGGAVDPHDHVAVRGSRAGGPSTEAAGNYGFALLFLPYLSSAFVPLATLPSGLRWFAEHQPLTPVIESIRGLLLGAEVGSAPLWAIGWCLVIMIAARDLGRLALPPPSRDALTTAISRRRPLPRRRRGRPGDRGPGRNRPAPSTAAVGAGNLRSISRRPNRTSVACFSLRSTVAKQRRATSAISISRSSAASSSTLWASARVKGPTAVRRSAVRCPPVPNACPRSRASART